MKITSKGMDVDMTGKFKNIDDAIKQLIKIKEGFNNEI